MYFLKKIVSSLGYFWSLVLPYSLRRKFDLAKDYWFTGYLKKAFNYLGEGACISRKSVISNPSRISIGRNVILAYGCRIECIASYNGVHYDSSIRIGDNCIIGPNAHITSMKNVNIGDNFLSGEGLLISDNNHGFFCLEELDIHPDKRILYSKGGVKIGNNVWCGDKVSILSGVEIGDGSIIGCNAVVTKNIPPYSLAVGNPARVIKRLRFSDNEILNERLL